MNQAFQVSPSRVILILALFSLSTFTHADSHSPDISPLQEQRFAQAISLLESFHNDSANVILVQLLEELKTAKQIGTPFGLHVRLRHAEALEKDHKDEEAIQKLHAVVDDAQEQEQWEVLANGHLSLARLYEKLGFNQRCRKQLRRAEVVIFENDLELIKARYYVRIASYHRIYADPDSAKTFALAVVEHAHKNEQAPDEAVGHLLLGMMYHKVDFDEAYYHYRLAGRHWKAVGDYSGYAAIHSNLARLFKHYGKLDQALNHIDSSLIASVKAIEMGHERSSLFYSNYEDRAEIFQEMGQLDSALHYYTKSYELELEEIRNSKKEEIFNIAARYNEEQQAQQIKSQQELIMVQKARRNLLIGLCLIVLLFAGLQTRIYFRLQRTNRKNEAQAKELKLLDEVKSKFFGNISHELRTPLSLILGPLSVLLEQPESWTRDQLKKQLLVMQRNGKSLMQLVEEILDLSKLEANKMDLAEESTAPLPFFEDLSQAFTTQFEHEGIDFQTHFEVPEDLFIMLDRKKMEKVVSNFLYNALKFTPQGGKVSWSIKQESNHLIIEVADTGQGIPEKDLKFIFDRYFQSFQPGEIQSGGTGIGLAMVKEYAKLMGGRAYVKSKLGEGSQFYFELPLKKASMVENAGTAPLNEFSTTPAADVGSNFTILVVEDNRDLRKFIHQTLQVDYQRVLLAENGVQALELLEKHGTDIHLVVSDVMMPQMDGWTLLKHIKENAKWQNIPMIMLTSLASENYKLKALTTGVDDYLTKPFSVPELRSRIQNLLHHYHQRLEWHQSKEVANLTSTDASDPEELFCSEEERTWVNQLRQLIEGQLNYQKIGVEQLATAVYLSSRQLNRKLKRITGLSPAKFIKEVQLQAARTELEKGGFQSISAVAYQFGFEHQGTFSTSFKTRFGISPSEYSKNRLQSQISSKN